jgi:hypothetical protein
LEEDSVIVEDKHEANGAPVYPEEDEGGVDVEDD